MGLLLKRQEESTPWCRGRSSKGPLLGPPLSCPRKGEGSGERGQEMFVNGYCVEPPLFASKDCLQWVVSDCAALGEGEFRHLKYREVGSILKHGAKAHCMWEV
eukprot:Sspe_Gene.22761::Locus_8704_Transcript_1_1_Confidence_1.000_Length_2054::g.22761::m.22761